MAQSITVEKSVAASSKKRLVRRVRYVFNLFIFFCITSYVILSIAGAVYFTSVQDRSLGPYTPASFGLNYSEVSFPASQDNLTIRGWFVPAKSDRVIITLHGKGTNRTAMLHRSLFLAEHSYNLLMIDLRAHGTSDGNRLSFGYYEQRDVLGAVNYLKGRGFKPEHIGVFGHSMGASVGLMAMAQTPDIHTMVADSSYDELSSELNFAIGQITGGWLSPFLPGMLVTSRLLDGVDINQVKPVEAVKHLNGRFLFLIQGDKDALVSPTSIYKLKAAAGNSAETWVVPGADHINADTLYQEEYFKRVLTFFQKNL
jgi:pimeloyl-ACP methyl ester carboxylesterase